MKLAAWMTLKGVTDTYVAGKLKVSSEAIRLLRLEKRQPSYAMMKKLMKLTERAVMPNDYFG